VNATGGYADPFGKPSTLPAAKAKPSTGFGLQVFACAAV
jgi:hypothetical protein